MTTRKFKNIEDMEAAAISPTMLSVRLRLDAGLNWLYVVHSGHGAYTYMREIDGVSVAIERDKARALVAQALSL